MMRITYRVVVTLPEPIDKRLAKLLMEEAIYQQPTLGPECDAFVQVMQIDPTEDNTDATK